MSIATRSIGRIITGMETYAPVCTMSAKLLPQSAKFLYHGNSEARLEHRAKKIPVFLEFH